MSNINNTLEKRSDNIVELIKSIHQNLTEMEERLIRRELGNLVKEIILDIGNGINAKTNEIDLF